MPTVRQLSQFFSVVVGLSILVAVGWHYSLAELLTTVGWQSFHFPVILSGLFVLYLVRPFFLWPLSVFSVFIGYVFGFPLGVPIVLAGTVLTCLPPFLIASRFDKSFQLLSRIADQGSALVATTGELRGMIAARLSPTPADAVSYGAGFAGISTRVFAVGTLIGELPWAVFYIVVGRSLRTFSVAGIQKFDIRMILLAGVISILLIARPAYVYLNERMTQSSESNPPVPDEGDNSGFLCE